MIKHLMTPLAGVLCFVVSSTTLFAADAGPALPKAPPDWKVEIIAKTPELKYPSVCCVAPDGRIFVGEDPMDMPGPSNQPIDRVLCIHPDGKITVFAEKLYSVFGIQYLDGKVYVHHCPFLSVWTDDNGVGKDRVDLINSTNPVPWGGTNLNDHIPANFHLAMDGYLYMAVGDKGIFGAESNVDHRKAELFGGGLLRIRPDGTEMEVYSTGTRNHLDVSINAEDEMFTYDNTDDGHGWWTRFTHMVDGGFYGYPYDYRPQASDIEGFAKYKAEKGAHPTFPYTLWRIDEFGGGSPCGAIAYNEDALPEEYRGNLFHCEWGKGELDRFVVERDGGSFKIAKREPFLTKGNGGELRPLGVNVLPDGTGLVVADWNFGGWKNKQEAGRLIKVTYTGKMDAAPRPAWLIPAAMGQKFTATTAELVAALAHPAQYVRLVAQRRVAERGAEAVPMLVAMLKDAKSAPHARWSAIWTLDKIDGGKAGRDAILAVLKDDGAPLSVRMQAARQLGERKVSDAISPLVSLLNHADAAMRFRAATALGRIGSASAVTPLMERLSEKDFFAHYAVFFALGRIGRATPAAWAEIVKGLNSDKAEVREGCVCAMHDAYDEALVTALSSYLNQTGNLPEGRAAAIDALAPIYKKTKPWTGKWWGTQPFAGKKPAREVEWAGTAPAVAAINAGLKDPHAAVRTAALRALQIAPDPTTAKLLVDMFGTEKDTMARKSILGALAAMNSDLAGPLVLSLVKDPVANVALLPEALTLAKQNSTPEINEALVGVAGAEISVDMIAATCEALGKAREVKAVPVLAKRISHAEAKVAEAAATALGFIKSDESNTALIGALKDKRGSVRKAAAVSLEKLRPVTAFEPLMECLKDGEIRKEVQMALATIPDVRALDVYLEGLGSKDNSLRDRCRTAMKNIHEKALPLIEEKLDAKKLSTVQIDELQKIYKPYIPEGKDGGKLFKQDTKDVSPEAFTEFAKSHKGDAENGKKIFFATNGVGCMKCHKIGNDGGEVGPSLSGVASKYDKEKLIESVLYPSKFILDGYQQTTIKTAEGQVLVGIIRGETDKDVTLLDANGQKNEIKKENIKLRKTSEQSLMPEGLHSSLKPEEFTDLIQYLESLKEPVKK
jgi:putative membrane-bound dehydrogenase-like protein